MLFKSEGLPVLFKQRAVLFPQQASVDELFQLVQYPGVCQQQNLRCCLTWKIGFETVSRLNGQRVDSPLAMFVEGLARVVDNDDGSVQTDDSQGSADIPHITDEDVEIAHQISLSVRFC